MKITVKNLKDYLSQFDEDLEVILDTNGWDYDEEGVAESSAHEIIDRTGLFDEVKLDEDDVFDDDEPDTLGNHYLVINN